MAGLLGFMAAGAAKGYSEGKSQEIEQRREFDLKTELLDAQMEKEMRLKEAGFEMDNQRASAEMERNKSYMADVEVQGEDGTTATRPATTQDGFDRAMKGGDLATAEKFSKAIPKRETFTLSEGQKVVDASGNVIAEGTPKERKIDVNEMILKAAQGDKEAQKFLNTLTSQEVKKAAAGRAPRAETEAATRKRDFIEAYRDNADYVKDGKLTSKGYDKFNKLADSEVMDEVTEKTTEVDKFGNPIKERSVKTKVPKSADKVGKYVPGKGVVYD
jgi:hypothetical protein